MDARNSLLHNLNRKGLIAYWNKAALLGGELCRPDFFAWYSDHDWVDRRWLKKLSQTIDEDSNSVLAYAKTVPVNRDGNIVDGSRSILDTTHMSSLSAVRAVTLEYYGAGDVIYGLFRYPVLRQCHFLPKEFLPDRLTVSEISLRGTIRYVPDVTRFRRDLSPDNYSKVLLARQAQTLVFPLMLKFSGHHCCLMGPISYVSFWTHLIFMKIRGASHDGLFMPIYI